MASMATREQLEHLLRAIAEEREAAKNLDMPGLTAAARKKEGLFATLHGVATVEPDCEELLQAIRRENRRNAFLFWTGLNLVRDTVAFFEKQVPPPGYGAAGAFTRSPQGGKLLSGRV